MTNTDDARAVRSSLKFAWTPFFAKFGRLTAIQTLAIPRVLSGVNTVLGSPTASGKTEAVVAPVAERLVSERWPGLSVLYIVPTRALANDTLVRIEGPLSDMGIRADLKHGDKPHLSKVLPNLLVTTPESLDSLICRRPGIFGTVRTVILDEIHLLDNTYRGDQLRVLLVRLRKLCESGALPVHLLSATLGDPYELACRYVDRFEVITAHHQRDIDHYVVSSLDEVCELARGRGWEKVLCFCNLRESVEAVAAELAPMWKPYPVVAHHGSLNHSVREEAEQVMKEAHVAICVATSTLEIGIDIGDIDLVVLAEVPWSLSALLQRTGRGNRREGVVHVAAVGTSPAERIMLEAMFGAATGPLPAEPYQPHISVAVQQVFSCAYAHPQGFSEDELTEVLSPICTADQTQAVLGHLGRLGWIQKQSGTWFASARLMDLGEKGRIHSNIPDSTARRVVDVDSGKEIGRIAGVFDQVFILGRRTWQVVSVTEDFVRVRPFKGKASPAIFQRHRQGGAFYHLLPPDLKCEFAAT